MAGTRTVKQPDVRKQELLDTAMRLFTERGFDNVSMRDIARAAGVTPGLAYHYFDSKHRFFHEALDAYALKSAQAGIEVLDDPALSLAEKIDVLLGTIEREEELPYHAFFHRAGNRGLHDQLSTRLCDVLVPHLAAALAAEARRRGASLRAPQTLADFVAHGLVNIMSDPDAPDADALARIREYIAALFDSQLEAEAGEPEAGLGAEAGSDGAGRAGRSDAAASGVSSPRAARSAAGARSDAASRGGAAG